MQALSLEVLLRTVYGIDDDERVREYHRRVGHMLRVSNIPVWVPALRRDAGRLSPWGRFLRARAAFDQLVHEDIDRGRADPAALDERDDVLSMLLQARREDGSPLTREELRDELTTVIIAGHETTATGLSWFFERVLRHPEVEERLRSGDDAYMEATVHEVMRTRPPFFDVVRRLTRDAEVGGYRIPAGMMVGLPIVLVHQRPDVYPEPHLFRPERFLDAAPGGFTWIPFGGGVHRCIGASFSLLEMRTIARAILDRTRLRVTDPAPETPRTNNVMVVPGNGTRVVLEERLVPATSVTTVQGSATAA
jgi:cytochrome P450